jgi:hypothetical protein
MQATLSALKELADVDLVEFTPIEPEENWNIAVSSLSSVDWTKYLIHCDQSSLYFCDGGQRMKAQCAASGEPVLPLTEWVVSQAGTEPVTLQQYSKVGAAFKSPAGNRIAYFT